MKKTLAIGLVSAFTAGLFLIPNLWAVDAPCGEMMLKVPAGVKAKKGPVPFKHSDHKAYDCKVCHHTWDGKSEIKKCSASGCHDDFKTRKSKRSYYAAFHDKKSKRSCVGCHKMLKKEHKPTGPTSCNKCHTKKK